MINRSAELTMTWWRDTEYGFGRLLKTFTIFVLPENATAAHATSLISEYAEVASTYSGRQKCPKDSKISLSLHPYRQHYVIQPQILYHLKAWAV
jgi:hypothetical protein